jgi:hypothetical protein
MLMVKVSPSAVASAKADQTRSNLVKVVDRAQNAAAGEFRRLGKEIRNVGVANARIRSQHGFDPTIGKRE